MSSAAAGGTPRTFFGHDSLGQLPPLLARAGARRVFIITGPSRRFLEHVQAALNPLDNAVYDHAKVHVPENLVVEAAARVEAFAPDTLLTLGGGAATGLGKALRLRYHTTFIAIPTTYAGSEMTALWGITAESAKKTGWDERVRPDAVFYDPALTAGMSEVLATQSLLNALAHPISALSTGRLSAPSTAAALEAAREVFGALGALEQDFASPDSRLAALRGASLAGAVLDLRQVGLHHRLAHLLGGRFGLDHAGLHSVLLPHSVRELARERPDLYATLSNALGTQDVAGALERHLQRVGAPRSLAALGAPRAAFSELADAQAAPAQELLWRAYSAGASQ